MHACMHPASEQLLEGVQISLYHRVMKQDTKTVAEETAEFGTDAETGLESLKHCLGYGMVADHAHAVARCHRV